MIFDDSSSHPTSILRLMNLVPNLMGGKEGSRNTNEYGATGSHGSRDEDTCYVRGTDLTGGLLGWERRNTTATVKMAKAHS